MRLLRLMAGWAGVLMMGLALDAAPAGSQWNQPANAIADKIAAILGPGQAILTIRNFSTIPSAELPSIRGLLEQDLQAHGIVISGGESASTIRITLSQSESERLWVAEVIQGNEARVVMVDGDRELSNEVSSESHIILRKERYLSTFELNGLQSTPSLDPIVAGLATNQGLVLLRPRSATFLQSSAGGWQTQKNADLGVRQAESRDPRGVLTLSSAGSGFDAFVPGAECEGTYAAPAAPGAPAADGWSIHCHPSDDPWPILQRGDSNNLITIKAFYNAARNYFTGVVTPSIGVDLPPFYSAALLPRPAGSALLISGVDGKVQLAENGNLKGISGARDWGSDLAVLKSGCGSGEQVIASGSGEAANDSLRAYELPAQEAVPVSGALSLEGAVTTMWPASDGKSVFAVVRGTGGRYEVDRVTALCN